MLIQGILMKQTQENGKKPSFGSNLGLVGLNSSHKFFFKNLALSVARYHSQLSSCTISGKTNDPILRKPSDGRTNGQTEGGTDGQVDQWFHRLLSTNIECPQFFIVKTFKSIPSVQLIECFSSLAKKKKKTLWILRP